MRKKRTEYIRKRTGSFSAAGLLATFIILIWLALLPGLCLGATTNQISQFDITWTFDKEYEYGQFANGDYWVVGPVTIVGINPPSIIDIGDRIINGAMIDPTTRINEHEDEPQALDYPVGYAYSYLNVARPNGNDLSPSNPLIIQPNHSLISSISVAGGGQVQSASILTILGSVAPAGSFRPPYAGTDKTIKFKVSDLDYSRLASLIPVASTPRLKQLPGDELGDSVERMFERPWIDWQRSLSIIHPTESMPAYGTNMAKAIGTGLLSLNLNYSDAEKQTLMIRLVQLGIDFYGVVNSGAGITWISAGGGFNTGRKLPIVFSAAVLNDPDMKSLISKTGDYLYSGSYGAGNPPPDYYHFSEDNQIFYVSAEDIYSQPYELKYSDLPQSGGTKTGGVKVTQGSNVVEGVGTSWLNINLANNPFFAVKNDIDAYMAVRPVTEVVISGNTYYYPDYVIESIDSNTQLTLNKAYRGDTNQTGNAEYVIARIVWYGHGNTKYRYDTDEFTNAHLGLPEWAPDHALYPNAAGANWGIAYRGVVGEALCSITLPALIMDLKELWNHDALFDYTDRWMEIMVGQAARSGTQFSEDMWDTYRADYGCVWTRDDPTDIYSQGHYVNCQTTFLYGDVNGNGEVTSYDAALAARYAVGLETFTDEQRQRADVTGNGAVSAYDVALIAQRAVGLIDRFPVEE